MDKDTRFDDTVGRETVELDDLQIDEEKNMEIKFGGKFEKYQSYQTYDGVISIIKQSLFLFYLENILGFKASSNIRVSSRKTNPNKSWIVLQALIVLYSLSSMRFPLKT